jgi:TolB protein
MAMASWRPAAALVTFVVLSVACTRSATETTSTVDTTPQQTSTAGPAAVDRILVIDEGAVVTMDRDGASRRTIADAGDVIPFQPTWAPDGVRVAYSEVSLDGPAVVMTSDDGEEPQRFATDSNVFYMYWSPDGSRLTSLRESAAGGLQLDILDVEANDVRTIDGGQPLYYSWSPDSDRLATHIGVDRLELLDPAGGSVELGSRPGAFPSPQWTPLGIFHLSVLAVNQALTLTDPDGEPRILATVPGPSIFTAARSGARVAVQSLVDEGAGIDAAYLQDAPLLAAGRLVVIDVATGEHVEAGANPVAAFFWSPGGDRLLSLTGDGRSIHWEVWDDGGSTAFPDIVPSPTFIRDYLAFFDQYAQSSSLWAPDGSAFVFPGSVDGVDGIWRQDARPDAEPVRISSGTWAVWSPV